MVVTRKKEIAFIDLGFEDALRLKEVSSKPRHRDKVFIGIERPSLEDTVKSNSHNLELRWRGVLKELDEIPDNSVRIVNTDFLFTEYYAVGWKQLFPRAQIDELTEGDLGWRASAGIIPKVFKLMRQETVNQVRRVLTPNGRFYITEYNGNLGLTLEYLDEAGFSHQHRNLNPDEMEKTTFLKKIKEKLDAGEADPEMHQPVRIVAIRKQ